MKATTFLLVCWLCPLWMWAQWTPTTPLSYAQIDSLLQTKQQVPPPIDLLAYARQKALKERGGTDSLYLKYTIAHLTEAYDNHRYNLVEEEVEDLYQIKKQLSTEQLKQYYTEALLILANVYQSQGRLQEAMVYQEELVALAVQIEGENSITHQQALISLAQLKRDLRQFEAAERILQAVLGQQKETIGKENMDYAYTLFVLASLYTQTHQSAKALQAQQEILPIIEKLVGKDSEPYQATIANMATSYSHLQQYDKAESLYLQIMEEQTTPSAILLNNLAIIYNSMGRYKESEALLRRSLELEKAANRERGKTITITYINLAQILYYQKLYQEAHQALRLSLWTNSVDLDKKEVQERSMADLVMQEHYRMPYLVSTTISMLDKLYEAQYKEQELLDILKKRHQNLLLYAQYVERMTTSFQTAGDKLWQVYIANDEYHRGIQVANLLTEKTQDKKWLEEALVYVESNKAALLGNAMKNNTAYAFGKVPEEYLEQEQQLKKEASQLQKQLQEALLEENNPQVIAARKAIVKNDEAIKELTTYLENNYPAYYQYKYGSSIISIEEARAVLPNDQTAVLEYYFWKDSAYVLVLTKQDIHLISLNSTNQSLKNMVSSLRRQLSNYKSEGQNSSTSQNFNRVAYKAYQRLVAPALATLQGIEHLIVVPDNILAQVPFEVFLTRAAKEGEAYKDLPYLLHNYSLSYSYSLGLLTQNNRPVAQPSQQGILGVAPSYILDESLLAKRNRRHQKMRQHVTDLPAAQQEIAALEANFKGHYLYREQASEAQFKELAEQYPILHLAMHGKVNEHVPLLSALLFTEVEGKEDNFLEAHEISHLQLNAELVVLSACETGYGTYKNGEGVYSLARSFMYAGAPSMVVSLWTVNDYSTAVIMEKFYQQLEAGKDKAEALRQAKLQYLNENQGVLAHPNFWSPFVQLGNSRPITLQQGKFDNKWPLGIGVLVVLIAGLVFLARQRRAA